MNVRNIVIGVLVAGAAYGAYYYFTRRKKTKTVKRGNWEFEVEVEDQK